jgi:rhodanese-related sulfurtransferase
MYSKLMSPAGALALMISATLAISTGCDKGAGADASGESTQAPAELSVDQVSDLLTGDAPPRVLDANNADTRKEYGTVPGATLLSSYDEYDVAAELGSEKEKQLVFYCGSTACKAAEGAAKRALAAGYTDVAVMPAGIKGWAKAGKTVATPES